MKRNITHKMIVIATTAALLLGGCGGSEASKDSTASTAEASSSSVESETAKDGGDQSSMDGSSASDTKGDQGTEETTTEVKEPAVYEPGVWKGNVFTSKFSGIKFKCPDGYTAGTESELATMMNLSYEDSEAYRDKVRNQSVIYDMSVTRSDGVNLMLGYDNLAASGTSNSLTAKEYCETTIEQLPSSLKDQYGTLDQFKTSKIKKKKLGSMNYEHFTVKVAVSGTGYSQEYYVRTMDQYIEFIIITITNTDEGSELIKGFQ